MTITSKTNLRVNMKYSQPYCESANILAYILILYYLTKKRAIKN